MEVMFHQQFYRAEPEVTIADLSKMHQLLLELVEAYLTRFKTTHFKCKLPLPETEFVWLVQNGLEFELLNNFEGTKFKDLFKQS